MIAVLVLSALFVAWAALWLGAIAWLLSRSAARRLRPHPPEPLMTVIFVVIAILAAAALTWALCRPSARRSHHQTPRLHHIAFRKPASRRVLSRSSRRRKPPDA